MGITHHIKASIEGLLKLSDDKLSDMFNMSGKDVRADLKDQLTKGHIYVGSENCEGFDPIKGCPGHEEKPQAAVWVKASERLPGWGRSVKWRLDGIERKKCDVFYMANGESPAYMPNYEWYDESRTATTDDRQTNDTATVNAKYLCTFENFEEWVSKARSWIGGHRKGTLICIDNAGNLCLIGEDFMAVRDFKLFPVKAYRMIKTIEAV
jgi:hypothetical protein